MRNGEPSVMQVYTRVPTMRQPSAANNVLYTTRVPDAAMAARYELTARRRGHEFGGRVVAKTDK